MVIPVPFKPFLVKYLQKRFAISQNYKLSLDDPLGISLSYMLKRPPKGWRYPGYDCPHILVDVHGLKDNDKVFLPNKSIARLNKQFDLMFRCELFRFVDDAVENGSKIEHSILLFKADFSITEEDLTLSTVLRSYQRYRSSGKIYVDAWFEKIVGAGACNLSYVLSSNLSPKTKK